MAYITSQYRANVSLNWDKGTATTPPTNLYVALLTTMPTKNDLTSLVECSASGYARQQITPAQWAAITTNGDNLTQHMQTNVDVSFPVMATQQTIVGAAIYDALTVGNNFYSADLQGGSVVVGAGTVFKLLSGSCAIEKV